MMTTILSGTMARDYVEDEDKDDRDELRVRG